MVDNSKSIKKNGDIDLIHQNKMFFITSLMLCDEKI